MPSIARAYLRKNLVFAKCWNELEPHVYLDLVQTLAPFTHGLQILNDFAQQADRRYITPLFLANVVLAPINGILDSITSINKKQKLVDSRKNLEKQRHKLRLLFKYWYTYRYLQVLTKYAPKEHPNMLDLPDNWALQWYGNQQEGMDIAKLGVLPAFLLHLPRQFRKWDDTEEIDQNNDGFNTPFNTKLPVHHSFFDAVRMIKKPNSPTEVKNHASWDPVHLADKFMEEGQTEIQIQNFYKGENKKKESQDLAVLLEADEHPDVNMAELRAQPTPDQQTATTIKEIITRHMAPLATTKTNENDNRHSETLQAANRIANDLAQKFITPQTSIEISFEDIASHAQQSTKMEEECAV
jgi:hypothetical protein